MEYHSPEFNIQNTELLRERPYYKSSPRHVLLLVDGDRRFSRENMVAEEAVYDRSQRICADFYKLCLDELDLDQATIFYLRPTCFEEQERSAENLKVILGAGTRMAKNIFDGTYGFDHKNIRFETISLAGRPWMETPNGIKDSPEMVSYWEELKEAFANLQSLSANQPKVARFLINYSGSAEIKALIDGSIIEKETVPQVGLLIRTGDGLRISDGPLYGLTNAHLHLIPKYLPATTMEDFREVITRYIPSKQ